MKKLRDYENRLVEDVILGVRNEACDAVWPQHHGCYKVDESVLVKGAALHVQTALDLLGVDLQ